MRLPLSLAQISRLPVDPITGQTDTNEIAYTAMGNIASALGIRVMERHPIVRAGFDAIIQLMKNWRDAEGRAYAAQRMDDRFQSDITTNMAYFIHFGMLFQVAYF